MKTRGMIILKRALIMMLLAVMTTVTVWADQYKDWTYIPNSSYPTCIITGYTGVNASTILVPKTLNGYTVVDIYSETFKDCTDLGSLVLYQDTSLKHMPDMTNHTYLSNIILINDQMETVAENILPASITSLGNEFRGSGIRKLTLPYVTSVGDHAFEGCNNLKSVTFQKAASIGINAFSKISSKCTITYPGMISNWSSYNFCYSPNLVVNCYDGKCGWCGDGWSEGMSLYQNSSCLYWTLNNSGNLTIDCVPLDIIYENNLSKQIIKSWNWDQTQVTSLTLNHVYALDKSSGDRVGDMGDFYNHNNLINVVINDGLVNIGRGAFSNCTSLESIVLPSSVKYIGEYAFADCDKLVSVILPASLTTICYSAFLGGIIKKDIYFDGTKAQWDKVTKGWDKESQRDGLRWHGNNDEEHWRCMVTFDANGHGTAPAAQTSLWSNEDKAANPGVLSAEGYVFTGWYTDAACTTQWNFDTDVVPGDITLYAGWTDNLVAATVTAEETSIDIPYGQEWTDIPVTVSSLTLGWFQNSGVMGRQADAVAVTPFVGSGAGSGITFFNTSGDDNFYAYRGAGEHEVGNRVTEAMTATGETGKIWVYIPKETWKSAAPGDYLYRLPYDAVFYSNSVSPAESYNYSLGGDAQVTLWVTIPESSIATGIQSMDNGQWIMDNSWYTMDGGKLCGKPTKKGVYIHNGKKAIVN